MNFNPEKVDEIAPGGTADVGVSMTPSTQAIAGDYMVSVRANGEGASDSANFRVTVLAIDPMGSNRPRRHRRLRVDACLRRDEVWTAMSPVIEARGLIKRYGRFPAVDGIDLTVLEGEVFGVLGPNGSGKTTTILLLLGLTEPTAGSIRVLGLDPLRQPLAVKRRVGYLPDRRLLRQLTAWENLAYTARLGGMNEGSDSRIIGAFARVRLADRRQPPRRHFFARHAPAPRNGRGAGQASRNRHA